MKKSVDIVVPCYNEEEMLNMFFDETTKVIDTLDNYSFRFIFIDDGSRDNTHKLLMDLGATHNNVSYLSFSRNFGKEAGIYAGLSYTTADYVIVMDADLQHPPALIPMMIKNIEEGYDCCAAMRTTREGESKVRSFFSRMFYRLSNKITDVNLVQGAVDYRIMSRPMVDAIMSMSEKQRFSKGIFAWVGFKTKWIPYENVERLLGTTKWSFLGLLRYAVTGITTFSIAPIRFVTGTGFFIATIGFLYILFTIIKTLIFGIDVPGYVTTLSAVLFLGGIIEISLGILGEYIANIYIEVKNRPMFILKDTNIPLTKARKKKEL